MEKNKVKKVLFVTYEFPPRGGSGVQRIVKFIKYLPKRYWEGITLTAKDIPTSIVDKTLSDDLPKETQVYSTFSLEPTRFYRFLLRLKNSVLQRRKPPSSSRGVTNLPTRTVKFIQAFFIPDEKIGWLPWATHKGKKIARDMKIDAVLSTGPPNTTHLVGLKLKKKIKKPWIADFRDPWVGNFFNKPATTLHSKVYNYLERKVVRSADKVISANEAMTRFFLQRYPKEQRDKFITLTNGYDPHDFNISHSKPQKFVITYTGTFYGARNPNNFLKAIKNLLTEHPELANDLKVRFVGASDSQTDRIVSQLDLDNLVEMTGYVSHIESVRYLLESSMLLLIVSPGPESEMHLAGKVFEYLAARKPILALVGEGEAAKLVKKAKVGIVISPSDISSIKEAILRFYEQYKQGQLVIHPDQNFIEQFDRKNLTSKLAKILDNLVATSRQL